MRRRLQWGGGSRPERSTKKRSEAGLEKNIGKTLQRPLFTDDDFGDCGAVHRAWAAF